MTPEKALEGVALHERALRPQSAFYSERFLGRLINLHGQLTIPAYDGMYHVSFLRKEYCEIIDDLDNIIRSIERDLKTEA